MTADALTGFAASTTADDARLIWRFGGWGQHRGEFPGVALALAFFLGRPAGHPVPLRRWTAYVVATVVRALAGSKLPESAVQSVSELAPRPAVQRPRTARVRLGAALAYRLRRAGRCVPLRGPNALPVSGGNAMT